MWDLQGREKRWLDAADLAETMGGIFAVFLKLRWPDRLKNDGGHQNYNLRKKNNI